MTVGLPTVARCVLCGGVTLPRKVFCPTCGSTELVDEQLPATGEVFSHTTIPHPDGTHHRIALVNSAGIRLLVPVGDDSAEVTVGCLIHIDARATPPGYQGVVAHGEAR